MTLRVSLTVFHDEEARSDWSDYHVVSEQDSLADAKIDAHAARHRMLYPLRGRWVIEVSDTVTGEIVYKVDG